MAHNSGNDNTGDYGDTDGNVPASLTALYQADYELMNDDELTTEAERLFCELTISDSDVRLIKEATVAQHNCVAWTEQHYFMVFFCSKAKTRSCATVEEK